MGDHVVKSLVLLAAYNGEKHLPELLDSLCVQTDPDFSVLVQDDGSSDGTPEILADIIRKDSRFFAGNESGCHLGAAGNFLSLIRQADADLVFLCDQDDIWMPEIIAVLKQAIREIGEGTVTRRKNETEKGRYFTWPTVEQAREFRAKGKRLI